MWCARTKPFKMGLKYLQAWKSEARKGKKEYGVWVYKGTQQVDQKVL